MVSVNHSPDADNLKTLDSAILIAEKHGFHCFPCNADKTPRTPHSYEDAACDPDALRTLWHNYPGPLIGVATGEISGVDIFDVDCVKYPDAKDWWEANASRFPQTRTHQTQSGGFHLQFQHAAGLRCSQGGNRYGLQVRGLDVRGDAGYAIYWPAAGLPVISDAPIAPWPEWLLSEIQRKPGIIRLAPVQPGPVSDIRIPRNLYFCSPIEWAGIQLETAADLLAHTAPGSRNAALNGIAYRFGRMVAAGWINPDEVRDALIDASIANGHVRDDGTKAVRMALNAGLRAGMKRPRHG
jgi:hypothetical protein